MPGGFAVQARGLSKSYFAGDQELKVLRGVDLDIRQGEFVSVMGPSGSGKSTLLNLVGLLDVPTAGAIRLLGTDVGSFGANRRAMARRSSLGFVFQSFNLMPRLSALHNVVLPMAIAGVPRRQRVAQARRLLASVGLADRAGHRPSELSGGQKQRVAIARALALDPPILLADEPTGNLDSHTSAEVMELFRRVNRSGKTIIQVTHDPEMASYGTRTVHFRDGRIEREERVGRVPAFSVGPGRSPAAARPSPAPPPHAPVSHFSQPAVRPGDPPRGGR